MHIQTHVLSGWCVASLLPLTGRERALCMVAAAVADLDGLGIVFGEEAYWDYHHVVGHGLLAATIVTIALAAFSTNRLLAAATYFGLFHLHLLLDFFGSGPGWPIHYLWPLNDAAILTDHAWPLFSWQNIATAFALIGWTLLIAKYQKRTPLERLMPGLDRQLVEWIGERGGASHALNNETRSRAGA